MNVIKVLYSQDRTGTIQGVDQHLKKSNKQKTKLSDPGHQMQQKKGCTNFVVASERGCKDLNNWKTLFMA